MQTDIKQISPTVQEVTITVEAEKTGEAYQKFLQKSAKRFDVPGFRKGKAPLAMVERLHGERIRGLFEEDFAIDVFNEASQEHKLSYLLHPTVNELSWNEGEDFKVVFELEKEPKVEIASLEGLKIPFKPMLLEYQVDTLVENLARQSGTIQDVEAAEVDDLIDGNLSLEHEGQAQEINVNIKVFREAEDMVDKLEGLKTGDKLELELKGEDIMGYAVLDDSNQFDIDPEKTYPCTLEVNSVTRLVIPEADDEFAKDMDFADMAEMKAKIADDMREKVEHRNQEGQHSAILAKLYKDNPFELPRRTVSHVIQQNLENYSPEHQQILQEFVVQKTVSDMANMYLINALVERYELEATDEMIDAYIQHMAILEDISPGAFREKNAEFLTSEYFKDDALAYHILHDIATKNEFVEPEPEPQEPETVEAEKTDETNEEEQ